MLYILCDLNKIIAIKANQVCNKVKHAPSFIDNNNNNNLNIYWTLIFNFPRK